MALLMFFSETGLELTPSVVLLFQPCLPISSHTKSHLNKGSVSIWISCVQEVIYQHLEYEMNGITISTIYWNLQVGRQFGRFHDGSVKSLGFNFLHLFL
jgi:hypothetical protein